MNDAFDDLNISNCTHYSLTIQQDTANKFYFEHLHTTMTCNRIIHTRKPPNISLHKMHLFIRLKIHDVVIPMLSLSFFSFGCLLSFFVFLFIFFLLVRLIILFFMSATRVCVNQNVDSLIKSECMLSVNLLPLLLLLFCPFPSLPSQSRMQNRVMSIPPNMRINQNQTNCLTPFLSHFLILNFFLSNLKKNWHVK